VLLSPRATMFIVSARSRFAPIDIEKAAIRITRACRMTSSHKAMRMIDGKVSRPSFRHWSSTTAPLPNLQWPARPKLRRDARRHRWRDPQALTTHYQRVPSNPIAIRNSPLSRNSRTRPCRKPMCWATLIGAGWWRNGALRWSRVELSEGAFAPRRLSGAMRRAPVWVRLMGRPGDTAIDCPVNDHKRRLAEKLMLEWTASGFAPKLPFGASIPIGARTGM